MPTPLPIEDVPLQVTDPSTVHHPPPTVVTMDDAPPPEVAVHEQQRAAAYDAVHMWEGRPLHPYSEARERLFHRLSAADVPLPLSAELRDLDAYASQAVKILYLCAHAPQEFRHLRGDTGAFLEAIDQWGEEHVPRVKTIEAVTLALKIHNDAQQSIAVARPAEKKADEGN